MRAYSNEHDVFLQLCYLSQSAGNSNATLLVDITLLRSGIKKPRERTDIPVPRRGTVCFGGKLLKRVVGV